jgi:thioredoxin 1
MPFEPEYHELSLTREEVDRLSGPVLLEFGASWCGICDAFSPQLAGVLEDFPEVRHIRVEDGRGKRLGRSFRVKLWPTLVFIRDGQVVQQLARPSSQQARQGLEAITNSAG